MHQILVESFFARSECTRIQRALSLASWRAEWRSADDFLSASPIGLPVDLSGLVQTLATFSGCIAVLLLLSTECNGLL